DLLDRVCIALAAGRRTGRQRRHLARESILARSSHTSRTRRLHASAYAVLVQFEQCIPSFALRRRRSFFVAFDLRYRAGVFTPCSFRFLPVTDDRRPALFQFSVGRALAGSWFLIDLFCAVAIVATGTFVSAAIGNPGKSAGFTRCVIFAQASFVQADT